MSSIQVLILIFSLIFNSYCEVIEIEIDDGRLEGVVLQTRKGVQFHAFRKIPYAEPPIGSLRFQPPVAYKKWEGILNATDYGPACTQSNQNILKSEDCLHLNVFTKNLGSNDLKPVIFYIHGGGFENGTSSFLGPDYLLDRDIVLVTINYRLGPFGFLALGIKEVVGNMGMKDQALALKWVEKNIAHFGGNPESVTIAGMSAGSYSVTAHMISEMSKKLFHRVIGMSGAITWQKGLKNDNIPEALNLAKNLGCSTNLDDMLECINQKSADEISKAGTAFFYNCPIMPWVPVIEPDFGQERFLMDEPNELFKNGNFSKVPVIIGITEDEFIYSTSTLLKNDDTLKLLNEDFGSIAPECFFFSENNIYDEEQVANKLRSYYFPFNKIDSRSFNSLRLLLADGTIGYGVHRFTHFVSSFTDVYYYKFTYMGRYSYFKYPRNKPYGINHADDEQYLFSLRNPLFPEIALSDPENFIVERMTRMWEQFAKTGNPNNPSDEYLADMVWPKHDLDDEYFMDIGNDMVEKQGLFLERFSIWDNLEKSSSIIIRQSLTAALFSIIILYKNMF